MMIATRPLSLRASGLLRRLRGASEGNAAAQFAFILPVLVLVIIAIFEFGRLYWIQNSLQHAAEQTGRCLMANPTASSITTAPCAYTSFLPMSSSGITPTFSSASACFTGSVGNCRTITLQYIVTSASSDDPILSLLYSLITITQHRTNSGPPNITLRGQSQVPVS